MSEWAVLAESVVGIALALFASYVLALFIRRRMLSRHGGTFESSYRVRPGQVGRGWVLGLGRYNDGHLQWFRVFSVLPRPLKVWLRSEMSYVSTRQPTTAEAAALYSGHVIVECLAGRGGTIELAMSPASLTGFQAWLEASPPGTGLPK
ncbi:MAG: DUF2550 domain-containing protein [Marmoricola sp.]